MTEAETGAILGTDSTWEELLTFRTEEVINTEYALTCYVNDINREYTEVLTEYTVSGSKTDNIFSSITGTEEIQVLTDYVYGNQRIYGTGETTAYYLYDGTGSVTEQVNQRADLLNTYRYDPYGTLTSGNVGESNYYGYRGEETNPITGMQYLRYRYYDTAAGRFQTPDSYLGSLIQPISQNRYGYTGNNPVMHGDKSGHMPIEAMLIGLAIGSAVGWTISLNVGCISAGIESYNTQKANGSVNYGIVFRDSVIGGYSSGFGGFVGGAIEGTLTPMMPYAQIPIGALSNKADGIVTRFSEALMYNWFTKEQKINVMQYTFDEDAIAADVVIGGGSAVLGMGADTILGKVLKKVPVAAVAKWFIDQRNKICGTSNSVNSGNPIRKGLDINLQFFAMEDNVDEAVEVVGKNSDATRVSDGIQTGSITDFKLQGTIDTTPINPFNGLPENQGYDSFIQLKNAIGSPGEGNHWHHIVEQSQIGKSGFSAQQIHNTSNIIAVDATTHARITGYYNSKSMDFTGGLSVRDWLAGQSYEYQYEFGLNVLRQFGVIE